jgi:peptidyl-dipeptidase A
MKTSAFQAYSMCFLLLACGSAMPFTAKADDGATVFLEDTENVLERLEYARNVASWNAETNISEENSRRKSLARQAYEDEFVRRAKLALPLKTEDPVARRKLLLLRLIAPAIPNDAAVHSRLAEVVGKMRDHYSKACPNVAAEPTCLAREKIEYRLAHERDPDDLKRLWTAWHDESKQLKPLYSEYIELKNRVALDAGYANAALMARAVYELEPAVFLGNLEQLWIDIRPLYLLLHSYVRGKLLSSYGAANVDPKGPIPIHLLGNLWGQDWENIFDLLAPSSGGPDFDDVLQRNMRPRDFIVSAERFFMSLGFPPLPQSFWQQSYFERPRDNFDCHPSAWFVGRVDWRLKMCIEPNWANFIKTHHEMGHIFYFQSVAAQPYLFRDAPNDAIHEAIGDAIALSVTPSYLQRIGLSAPSGGDEINHLLRVALRKLATIPFALVLEKWRWGVMAGDIPQSRYNEAWWALVHEYQGVAPPGPRPSDAFDPGAKYHVAADKEYIKYLIGDVLTFQIHDAMARDASCAEPLHRCSVYESRAAGYSLRSAMALGSSRHWRELVEVMTGEPRLNIKPMRRYLAPLETWLKRETAHLHIGWDN